LPRENGLNVDRVRGDFPIFNREVGGKKLIYLDSAATSQKPRQVIDAVKQYYENYNANVHRGVYSIGIESTEKYEEARKKAAKFINAKSHREIVFVRGTTEAINLVAYAWGLRNLRKGDKIILTEMEHHSNIIPWQLIARQTGAEINYIPFDKENGELDLSYLDRFKDFKVLSFVHASNVLGTINDVYKLVKYAHENNAIAIVDAAQSVPHMPVDVQQIGCDFLAFSGHKMLGPTGIGVLYGKREILEELEPFMGGGEMIREVYLDHATWNEVPWKFEAGTPNIAGAIGLGAAIDYLEKVGLDRIREHEESLTKHAFEELERIKGIRIYGPPDARERTGLVAFTLADIHPHDVATMLDEDGICVRAGHHCAMPIHTKFGIAASTRASFYLYNTHEEIEKLSESLRKTAKKFKIL